MISWRDNKGGSIKDEVLRTVANIVLDFGYVAILATALAFLASWSCWFDNLTHFRCQYIVLLAVCCAIWLIRRKRFWLVTGAIALLWNVGLVIPMYWPRPPAQDRQRATLTVVLSNVRTENTTPERVLEFLRKTPADIVVLEEVDEKWLERLEEWRQSMNNWLQNGQMDNFGIAVYSRLPRRNPVYDPLSVSTTPSISATYLFDGGSVNVLAAHPLPPGRSSTWKSRNRQYDAIQEWIAASEGNGIVVGDMNSAPWSPYFRRLLREGRLNDARRGFGVVPSWPSMAPIMLIPVDCVLVQDKLSVVSFERGPDVGSDHYPIIAKLQWKR
jgi:endonuclease/exonuclease/phosphatase (EEP) superfamily protein YafD